MLFRIPKDPNEPKVSAGGPESTTPLIQSPIIIILPFPIPVTISLLSNKDPINIAN